ncbi:hypothetical protein M758_7G094200 [Ceratodon purpureus]|uniref:Uncharacterized protein n=1 Tax=Ceratodon purpureus TaxID=3225 RepID=A0A8T0H9W6_CERPU|nr:hypothetical protein KC19_7G100600 [Ceratodon purpureus]KAG0610821.1 hypothetical protein M758_7G094200 [Ceratodon purpureus]
MSKKVSINKAAAQLDELSEEERRALRRSRFHAEQLQSRHPPSSNESSRPRLAHPGGALATNKAAALAKFLKRKLNEPGGAAALDPDLVERAVENAKATAIAGQQAAASSKPARIRHVDSFSDSDEEEILQRELKAEQHHRVKNKTKKNKPLDFQIPRIDHSSKKKKKEKKKKTKKS